MNDSDRAYKMTSPDRVNESTMDYFYGNLSDEFDPNAMYGSWITEDVLRRIRENFVMYRDPTTAVLIALYGFTFLLGTVGNVLVIYIFARCRHMRTVTNSFLVNLAVCDLMVVFVCMPFSVAVEIYQNWIYGDVMCRLVNFSQGLSVSASILTLTVISAERFYAIRRPLRARAFMSRARIRKVISAIWLAAAAAAVPSVLVRRERVIETIVTVTIRACVEEWHAPALKHAYNFVLLALLYAAPVAFICVGYLRIAANLWRRDSALYATSGAAESENVRANLAGRRKVARMLFVMALLFAVSWLPIHALSVGLDFLASKQLTRNGILLRHLHSYAMWLGHANSSINPVCYCIMSRTFKARHQVGAVMSATMTSNNCDLRNAVGTRLLIKRARPQEVTTCTTAPDLLESVTNGRSRFQTDAV
ncbi:hypothetical protein NP493_1404g00023 [Ridgeia piscesae]|uniref:G-protein coupled receptors family 1 profile domain-containing protein n=1 Tax=Ridgeia piscesae TaxID=27915 RepID=A0AAD9K618_RIDPI|nr:hypothetical protein NP493_1404g00023 [Ridgeia piscesae]